MTRARQRTALIAATLLTASGCSLVPWGGDVETELDEPAPNALVLVLGHKAFELAGGKVTGDLRDEFAEGVRLSGDLPLEGLGLTVQWTDLTVHTGVVTLAPTVSGIEIRITVSAEPTQFDVLTAGGDTLCSLQAELGAGILVTHAHLAAGKLGHPRATLVGPPELTGQEPTTLDTDCPNAELLDSLGPLVLDSLRDDTLTALKPSLAEALPRRLGLDLVGTASMTVGEDDGIGAGRADIGVRVPPATGNASWVQYTGEHLVVPYDVALQAHKHPCAPGPELEPPWATSVPASLPGTAGVTLMVSLQLARRALDTAWNIGLMCGDRLAPFMPVSRAELATTWPELGRLPPDATLSYRVWPERRPTLETLPREDGVDVVLPDGSVTFEILAELDGARVRLASVTVAAEATGRLEVGGDGTVQVVLDDLDLVGVGPRPGLLPAPSIEAAEALFLLALGGIDTTLPVWQLPPLPTAESLTADVGLAGDYVVFWLKTHD